MEVLSVEGFEARCGAKGVERRVNLLMLRDEGLAPGDHVLVHLGFAVQKMTAEDADSHWQLLDQMMMPAPAQRPGAGTETPSVSGSKDESEHA